MSTAVTARAPARAAERIQVLRRVRDLLPRGNSLQTDAWRNRHRAIELLLWLHAVAVPVFGYVRGFSVVHSLLEASPIVTAALLASSERLSRRVRTVAATIGIFTSSAVLVHLSGGSIEMHFHFFVMVAVIALYQDWLPFLLAIGYVLVHHGVMGAIAPAAVFNHPSAWAQPWRWAAIHAGFIAGISLVCLVTWRLNETAFRDRDFAAADLRNALSVLSATLDATADGLLVVDNSGRIINFNQRFVEMWQIPPAVLQTRRSEQALQFVLDQLHDPQSFMTRVRQLYSDPDAESHDELLFKDGRVFERNSQPHRVDGVSLGRVWSFRDVTQRKRDEALLHDAMRRDKEAVERLRALDEAKSLLMTAVSHEVRTPLTSIVGYAHTLSVRDESLDPERRRQLLERLVKNTERLQALVLDLFDLDRISRGALVPRRVPTDLRTLVAGVLEHIDVGDRPLQFESRPVGATVDPGMVGRLVENLVVNAVKHTPPSSPIDVEVFADHDEVQIVVSDRGPGIPEDIKRAVFEPFRQGTVPAHSPGTGIGLALVARFAAAHGGRAWVEDRAGGGSRFVVALPVHAN